jgi:hypothetical protein
MLYERDHCAATIIGLAEKYDLTRQQVGTLLGQARRDAKILRAVVLMVQDILRDESL